MVEGNKYLVDARKLTETPQTSKQNKKKRENDGTKVVGYWDESKMKVIFGERLHVR